MNTRLLIIIGIIIVVSVITIFFVVFGNISSDTLSENKLKTDAMMLSDINQLGLVYQKNGNSEKFEKQMNLMQEKQQETASRYLGITISEIFIKENWNFPFRESSDVKIVDSEWDNPICEIPENIPSHLQKIRQSEMFQIFSEKYSQNQLLIDISDERNTRGMVHYGIVATSDGKLFTASTQFHLDSCNGEIHYQNVLFCKDTKNDKSEYTRIKSEIISSLNNNDFCIIQLEPWHQELRNYQDKISNEQDILRSNRSELVESDMSVEYKMSSEIRRLGLLNDIIRYYESEYTDNEKMQEDLEKYDRMYGEIPEELQKITDKKENEN